MFCYKCGFKLGDGAGFCHKCGTKVAISAIMQNQLTEPSSNMLNAAEKQPVSGLFIPMCILRFIDVALWALLVINQISWGVDFWTVIWNVAALVVGVALALELLGVSRTTNYNKAELYKIANSNVSFSGVAVVWYGVQLIFWFVSSVVYISLLLNITVLILAFVVRSLLSKTKE